MHRLIVENGSDQGKVYVLDQGTTSVGRSVSNTIQIVDRRMSRNHSEITNHGGRVVLIDLGSKNGTLVNGELVQGSRELHQGDRVHFGDTILVYDCDAAPGSPNAPRPSSESSSAPPASQSPSSSGGFRVVDEHQWGSARQAVRAGFDPSQTASFKVASAADLRDANRRLEVMHQVTEAIRSVFTLEELLEQIVEIIQDLMHPDRSYILLTDPSTGNLEPVVVKTVQATSDRDVPISTSITQRCLSEGVSILVSDAAVDQRFSAAESIIMNRIRTAMVAPIIYRGDSLGVIYIDTQSRAMAFTNEELEVLTSIANQSAFAITNVRLQSQLVEQHKLAREMEIARTIQMNLLPKTYPDLPGYQLSAMSLPAKQVGGDYYDFLRLPDGRIGLSIADVSGKGVSAAMVTAITRSYLQSETQHKDSSLAQTLARINRMLTRDMTSGMYVTMLLAFLDPADGTLEYINAGHAYPVLIHPNGTMEFLKEGGVFLGIMEDLEYETGTALLQPGSVLVLYTDGVTDILDPAGKSYGNERFYELIRDKQHLSAEEIRNAIYQSCIKHRGTAEQFDDFTLMVLKRLNFNESEID